MSIYVPARPAPMPPPVEQVKAGPIGPGAGVLQTEYPLSLLRQSPSKKMRKAWQLGIEVPWIRMAERVISGRFAGASWHLEDPEGETIDDKYPDKDAVRAVQLLEKPQAMVPEIAASAKLSGAGLRELTSRHEGLCGSGFWYLDQREMFAGTPGSLLYLRPDLMEPKLDADGLLVKWVFNPDAQGNGTILDPADVLHFKLQEPDEGVFPPGLVETALTKITMSQLADKHVVDVLGSGGRLSGIVSPASGSIDDDNMYQQMVRDWRNITEQPNAAKRLQVIRAPVNFMQTTMSMNELGIVALMAGAADDLMALWGVPLSMVGIGGSTGLNSGDTRKYDEAALWQGPVHDRVSRFKEVVQGQLLDLWIPLLGWAPQLIIDEPEFDDDSPKYDKLQKSATVPLTNDERRGLIGFDPMEDVAFGGQVWLPATQVLVAELATPPASATMVELGEATPAQAVALDAINAGKARLPGLHASLVKLRANLDRTMGPRLRSSVQKALEEQKSEVVKRVVEHAEHLKSNPSDTSVWWNPKAQDARMTTALRAHMTAVAETVRTHVHSALAPQKAQADTQAVDNALKRGSARVSVINAFTRDAINGLIGEAITNGLSPRELGDQIEAWTGWDEYRAERIATTELMRAYNASAIHSYGELGATEVEAIDGDGDPECAARNGQVFSLDEAAAQDELEHPNGTLDWVPVLDMVNN